MRLFRKKPLDHEVDERCPQCGEPVPDGAIECMMCGVDLRPYLGNVAGHESDAREADSAPR